MITVLGYQHAAEQSANKDLSQCFVAMWFDESMKQAYEEGIEKAVEACGYKPLRIDQKQHLNKIDDEIIAEIRRSRFVVADFTHDATKGVRGGVYYEAGFAHALGLPVIFSCKKDQEKSFTLIHDNILTSFGKPQRTCTPNSEIRSGLLSGTTSLSLPPPHCENVREEDTTETRRPIPTDQSSDVFL